MLNHHDTERLATLRTEAKPSAIATRLRGVDCVTFMDRLRSVARQLYFSTPYASKTDRQFLQDLARDEARVQMKQLQHLMAIASKSTRPEHKVALVDLVRMHCDVEQECLDVVVASDLETEVQGPADLDTRMFEHRRDRPSKERALASLRRHFAAIRALIDSIEAQQVQ